MNKKEKSLLGKARAAINKLGFVKTEDLRSHNLGEVEPPKSATLRQTSSKMMTKEETRRSSHILPES